MSSPPKYQVAFKFQFQQNVTGTVQLAITDSNNFVVSAQEKAQLQGYSGDTPPLLNFSMDSKELFFNIDGGESGSGVESIVWSTFTNGGSAPSLMVNLQMPTVVIAASYMVLTTGSSGQLVNGQNTINAGD